MTARLKPKTIILQASAANSEMAQHVRAAHPDAQVVTVPFATRAFNGEATSLASEDHWRVKRATVAVLNRRATWKPDPNGRSTDFLPNIKLGTGCGFFCQYCYTERKKPNNFPKVYADALNMIGMVQQVLDAPDYWEREMRRVAKRPFERTRNPLHNQYITFDIGCDTDCTLDNQITRHAGYPGHVIDIMNQVAELGAMTSFASKGDDFDVFVADCKYPSRNRIRLSIMPEWQPAQAFSSRSAELNCVSGCQYSTRNFLRLLQNLNRKLTMLWVD